MLRHLGEFYPDMHDPAVQANRRRHEHQKAVWTAAAQTLRILANFENEARKFVAGLLNKWRGG